MGKFNKKLIVLGSLGVVIIGSLTYNLLNKPNDIENDQNKKEMIAMYIQDEDGNYQTSSTKEFPKEGYVLNIEKSTCKNGGMLSQESDTKKVKVKLAHSDQCTLYFDKEVPKIEIGDISIPIQDGNPNFANPATTDETANGLFSMEDDYGTSYYYRGTAPNNYIKFGKNSSGQDMWWRIIRINGDGSIRMQYDGSGASGSNTYKRGFALTSQVWNTKYNDAKYVGWMFGGTQGTASTNKAQAQTNETNSEIKMAVDNWYKSNIVDTGYSNYVHDAIFCNDRSTPGKGATGYSSDTGLGYGNNATGYGAYARSGVKSVNYNNVRPQFTCPQDNDKFTVSVENGGNGALTYPVGLITADEIVAAGSGKFSTVNSSYYLKKDKWYRSFSPANFFIATSGYALVFVVVSSGSLDDYHVYDGGAVAPAINIKPEYLDKLQGNGTINNPYFLNI